MSINYVNMLVKQETRKLLLPAILTGIFFAVMGVVSGVILLGLNDLDGTGRAIRMIQGGSADLVILSTTCSLGFILTKDYFSYYRTDAFSRKLAFYRKLAVTDKEIVLARYLVFLGTLPLMALCFFTALYLLVRVEQLATAAEFIQAVILWLGFSLAAGAGFMYLELGMPGKNYMRINTLVVGGLMLGVVLLNVNGIHLVSGSLALVRSYGAAAALAGLAAGGAVAWGVAPLMVRRLASRDLI